MVNINYSNILMEFSEKLTEKFREFTHKPEDKVIQLWLVVSLRSSIMTRASSILRQRIVPSPDRYLIVMKEGDIDIQILLFSISMFEMLRLYDLGDQFCIYFVCILTFSILILDNHPQNTFTSTSTGARDQRVELIFSSIMIMVKLLNYKLY